MNAKFRNIGRINLRFSARERNPGKFTRKKIAYLVGTNKNNITVTKKYVREIRTVMKGIKKLVFKQHGRESTQLFTKAGPRTAGLEPASRVRGTRGHAAARQNRLFFLKSDCQNERRRTMNGIAILLAVVFSLLVGFFSVQGVRAIIYSHSDEWKLQQRLRRFVQREAE
jgi:hypothetical protein